MVTNLDKIYMLKAQAYDLKTTLEHVETLIAMEHAKIMAVKSAQEITQCSTDQSAK